MALAEQADRIDASTGALPPIVFLFFNASIAILPNQVIDDVAAGKAAPGLNVLRRMPTSPILQTNREHQVLAALTIHGVTPQS